MVVCAVRGCPMKPGAKIWMDGIVMDELCREHGEIAKQFLESIELYENHVTKARKRD